MKILAVLSFLSLAFIGCEKESVMPVSDVPTEILSYVETHFPQSTISRAVKDKEFKSVSYEITLTGGLYLEFNDDKKVVEIKGVNQLPNSVIPSAILEYTMANFPNYYIIAWEIDDRKQQVTFNSGLELEFSMSGDFLRVDY
ncbi:MAG TPA: PepSY-like domain-containing protein [Tenuifilaceae bacterium]|nr:PepSY-like domain-containing protein [Tenuifilaceae bacterium]